MIQASHDFVSQTLPDDLQAALPEIVLYFQQSFGNETRLDYGTGHETTFVAYLYCLAAIGDLCMQSMERLWSLLTSSCSITDKNH